MYNKWEEKIHGVLILRFIAVLNFEKEFVVLQLKKTACGTDTNKAQQIVEAE